MNRILLVIGFSLALAGPTLLMLHFEGPFSSIERTPGKLKSYLIAPAPIHVELNHEISTAPIVALPLKGKSIIFGKTREALDQCRATVHALGGGLCEVAGFGTLYPNQGVPSQPQDALICITGKTCP